MSRHLVTISAENIPYHGWQAKVATYSCLKRQRVAPLIVVHGAHEAELHPDYLECERAGALVMRAKNYRGHGAHEWAARNTAAALLDAAYVGERIGADHLVILDPDMVWTRKVQWPCRLAVDKYCLDGLDDPRTIEVAKGMGLTIPPYSACKLGARVPYVVPLCLARPIGEAWWEAMATFAPRQDRNWADQMLAYVLAILEVGEKPARMRFSQTDWKYQAKATAPMIHYAYGSPYFRKRDYATAETVGMVWDNGVNLPVDSVQGWVLREIAGARQFFDSISGGRACA